MTTTETALRTDPLWMGLLADDLRLEAEVDYLYICVTTRGSMEYLTPITVSVQVPEHLGTQEEREKAVVRVARALGVQSSVDSTRTISGKVWLATGLDGTPTLDAAEIEVHVYTPPPRDEANDGQ